MKPYGFARGRLLDTGRPFLGLCVHDDRGPNGDILYFYSIREVVRLLAVIALQAASTFVYARPRPLSRRDAEWLSAHRKERT